MNGFWLRNFLRRFSPPLPLHTTNSGSSALSLISFWLLLATTPTCGSCQTKAFPYLLDSRETKDNDFFLGNDVKNFIYHIWLYEWVMTDLMRLFSDIFFQFINFDKQLFILILCMYSKNIPIFKSPRPIKVGDFIFLLFFFLSFFLSFFFFFFFFRPVLDFLCLQFQCPCVPNCLHFWYPCVPTCLHF